ncbi:MAG: 16S rRNA (guanine(527)-N(7))-methyltransferase RsmG [Magnetococcales bacterium]|nr:16S rRNA (guanine(527)-N(7))-methyltransferase RsmG [Magnetococcales bacterium]
MTYDWDSFFQHLNQLGCPVDTLVQQQLQSYVHHLLTWNQTHNLIGPNTIPNLLSRHILDSITLLPFLPKSARIADMGSGAGLPGFILALFSPASRQFHLYEANQKKSSFLTLITTTLGLTNRVTVHPHRVEQSHGDSGSFDITICRALSDLETIAKLSRALLRPGGICLAQKGKKALEETVTFQQSKQARFFTPPTIHPALDDSSGVIVQMRLVSRETGMPT